MRVEPRGDGDGGPAETSAATTHGSRCPPGRPGVTLPPSYCLRAGSPQGRCGGVGTASVGALPLSEAGDFSVSLHTSEKDYRQRPRQLL
jgi:hypothetical protein